MARAKKEKQATEVEAPEVEGAEMTEVVPQTVDVHGQKVLVTEIEETYDNGKVVHVKLLAQDGCTYEGSSVVDGKLV